MHRWWVLLLATALAGCECGAGTALDAALDSGADAAVEDCGPAHPSVACVGGGWFELAKYWWYGESQLPPAIEPSPLADVHLPTFWIARSRARGRAPAGRSYRELAEASSWSNLDPLRPAHREERRLSDTL